MAQTHKYKIDIALTTLFKVIGVILLVALFFKVWEIMISLFLAVVIAAALEPALRWFEAHKLPRIIMVPTIYLLATAIIFGIFYAILPTLFNEVFTLSQDLPERYSNFVHGGLGGAIDSGGFLAPALDEVLDNLQQTIGNFVPDIFKFLTAIFGGILSFFLVVIFSFYLSLRRNDIEKSILALTPLRKQERVKDLIRRIQRRTGRWLQATFVLATFMGVTVFLILSLLGVKYALIIGLLAGFLELIPYVGPFVAGISIFAIASTQSLVLGLMAVGIYILLQQFEQAFIIPTVMSRVVGLNPLAILLAVLIGAQLAGFWGIIVAIPFIATLREVFKDVRKHSKNKLLKERPEIKSSM